MQPPPSGALLALHEALRSPRRAHQESHSPAFVPHDAHRAAPQHAALHPVPMEAACSSQHGTDGAHVPIEVHLQCWVGGKERGRRQQQQQQQSQLQISSGTPQHQHRQQDQRAQSAFLTACSGHLQEFSWQSRAQHKRGTDGDECTVGQVRVWAARDPHLTGCALQVDTPQRGAGKHVSSSL